MAIAVDVTSTLDTNASSNPSWSHTCTGSDLLLVVLIPRYRTGGSTITAVSYNGVALTQAAASANDGQDDQVDIWYLKNPATGAHTVALTCSGITGRIGATSFTGVDQTTPVGTGVTNTGNSTTPTVDASSTTGEVVVGAMASDASVAGLPSGGAGQTPVDWASTADFEATASSHEAGSTTTTHSYTINSREWAIAALPIKPTGSSPQFAYPVSDISAGSWTGEGGETTSLYTHIDETSVNDADYIRSSLSPPTADVSRFRLGSLSDPNVSTGHVLHFRIGKDATAGARIDLTVTLYRADGSTVVKTQTYTNVDALTTYDVTLSGSEADSIPSGDYASGLVVEFSAVKV